MTIIEERQRKPQGSSGTVKVQLIYTKKIKPKISDEGGVRAGWRVKYQELQIFNFPSRYITLLPPREAIVRRDCPGRRCQLWRSWPRHWTHWALALVFSSPELQEIDFCCFSHAWLVVLCYSNHSRPRDECGLADSMVVSARGAQWGKVLGVLTTAPYPHKSITLMGSLPEQCSLWARAVILLLVIVIFNFSCPYLWIKVNSPIHAQVKRAQAIKWDVLRNQAS